MAWPLFDLFDLIVKCNLAVDKVWHGVKTDDIAREVIQEVPADQSEIEHQAIAAEAFHGCSALGQYPKGSFEVTVSQLFIKNQLDKTETVVLWQVKEEANKAKYDTNSHQRHLLHERLEFRTGSTQSARAAHLVVDRQKSNASVGADETPHIEDESPYKEDHLLKKQSQKNRCEAILLKDIKDPCPVFNLGIDGIQIAKGCTDYKNRNNKGGNSRKEL